MRKILLTILGLSAFLTAQNKLVPVTGKITFITTQNVYVHFDSTAGLKPGDTLYIIIQNDTLPGFKASFISMKSVAAEMIAKNEFKIGQQVLAYLRSAQVLTTVNTESSAEQTAPQTQGLPIAGSQKESTGAKITGRISLQSTSDFASLSAYNSQRWRSSVQFNVQRLVPTLDFTSYIIYSANNDDLRKPGYNAFNDMRIFDLAVSFAPDSNLRFWLGRHLNYKTANAGTIDGLQAEADIKAFSMGLVVGSRPDFSNYSFNAKLFQAGGYVSHKYNRDGYSMENTISAFHQTNHFKTDRDFLYLQHSNTLLPNTSIFFSGELDMYAIENGAKKKQLTLTGLFSSVQYRFSSGLSVNASYDARRNVVYFETYKSFLDSAFANNLRQGFRLQLNFRPADKILAGISSGYQYQKGDAIPSTNYNAYVYFTSLPYIDGDISLNASYLKNSFLKGTAASLAYTRSISQLISAGAGLRTFIYSYSNPYGSSEQYIPYGDIAFSITRNLMLSINYEGVFEKSGNSSRLFVDLTTRL